MRPLLKQDAKHAPDDGRDAFARQMMQELHRLAGQVHALATLFAASRRPPLRRHQFPPARNVVWARKRWWMMHGARRQEARAAA